MTWSQRSIVPQSRGPDPQVQVVLLESQELGKHRVQRWVTRRCGDGCVCRSMGKMYEDRSQNVKRAEMLGGVLGFTEEPCVQKLKAQVDQSACFELPVNLFSIYPGVLFNGPIYNQPVVSGIGSTEDHNITDVLSPRPARRPPSLRVPLPCLRDLVTLEDWWCQDAYTGPFPVRRVQKFAR